MMNLAEYRRSTTQLADFLPWAALVDEGVVLNKDGSFQRTAKFRGPDLDSAVPAELRRRRRPVEQRVAAAGLGLGRLCRSAASSRQPISRRPFSGRGIAPWSTSSAALQFEEEGAHYESSYFLTFLYLPPPEEAARAERFLYEGRDRNGEARCPRGPARLCRPHRPRAPAGRRFYARDRMAR